MLLGWAQQRLSSTLTALAVALPSFAPQSATTRDAAVVSAALQAVAVREFASADAAVGKPLARNVTVSGTSMPVSETMLRQVAVRRESEPWPRDVVDRVREANRHAASLRDVRLEGFERVRTSASANLGSSLPGYVAREAYVFVRIKMAAIHVWVVRLVQQDDGWRVVEAVPIAAS